MLVDCRLSFFGLGHQPMEWDHLYSKWSLPFNEPSLEKRCRHTQVCLIATYMFPQMIKLTVEINHHGRNEEGRPQEHGPF